MEHSQFCCCITEKCLNIFSTETSNRFSQLASAVPYLLSGSSGEVMQLFTAAADAVQAHTYGQLMLTVIELVKGRWVI